MPLEERMWRLPTAVDLTWEIYLAQEKGGAKALHSRTFIIIKID